ncbi:MAG: Na(+)/H(+) antiporter subunit C [Aeromicrobium sp.]
MTPNLPLVILVGIMVAAGVTLVLERSLTRILIGFVLIGNGVSVLYLVISGPAGTAPIVGLSDDPMSDPLPQAMVLTAIVITLGVTSFGLALAYRAWQLTGHDDVQDDVEDDLIRRRAEQDETSMTFDEADTTLPDEEGSDPRVPHEWRTDEPVSTVPEAIADDGDSTGDKDGTP